MENYCLRCGRKTENLNLKIFKAKTGRLIMQSKSAECGTKKSRFVKEQEPKRLLSNFGIKTPLRSYINARNAFKTNWFYLLCFWSLY